MLEPVVPVVLLPPTATPAVVPAPVAAPPLWRCTTSMLATVLLGAPDVSALVAAPVLPDWL